MRLADDDRGRVPFALVGALLLVASAGFAATVSRPSASPGPPDGAVAADRVTEDARMAIRAAVGDALERGAANPVLSPADTPSGRVLNETSPYRDALRVRAYVRVQRALARTTASVGTTDATVSLPPVTDSASLRTGKRTIGLEGSGNATVTVTVRNVSLVVRDDDGTVRSRQNRTFRVTLSSPALVLHDRVGTYDDRLDRGVADGHGFGRQFAARLYGLSWLRGYAQYGGAPVENVLGTRHVSLAANGAALATQRAVFGGVDAAASRAHSRALVRVGTRDLTEQYDVAGKDAETYLDAVLGEHPGGTFGNTDDTAPGVPRGADTPASTFDLSVDATAVDAFSDLLAGRDGAGLDTVLTETYTADVRTVVRVTPVETPPDPAVTAPGPNWERVDGSVSRTVTVTNATRPPRPSPGPGSVLADASRDVRIHRLHRVTWEADNETRTTTASTTEEARVVIHVVGRHDLPVSVDGRVPSAFDDRTELDPNLVDLHDDASAVLSMQGGVESIAERAVLNELDGPIDSRSRTGAFSGATRDHVYRDVASLRDRVRNISVTVDRGSVITGEPATAALLAEVRSQRPALVSSTSRHESVAAAASVAAQRAYLDHVERRLEARVSEDSRVQSRIADTITNAVSSVTDGSVATLGAVHDSIRDRDDRGAPTVENHLVEAVDVTVAGSPSYLVVDGVDAERVPSVARGGRVHPLATRNVNLFTVPTADVTDRAVDAVAPGAEATSLRRATRQLARARTVPDRDRTDALTRSHQRLRQSVARSMNRVRGHIATVLSTETSLSSAEATVAVRDAFDSYPGTTARAQAVVNGSISGRVVEAAASQVDDADGTWRDGTRTHVETAVRNARAMGPVRPADSAVTALRSALDEVAGSVAKNATREAIDGATNRTDVPFLGIPLAPVPGYWYATVNVWVVELRGTYPTFAVRTRNGSNGPLGSTTYVRDGSTVAVDVDGDGTRERLGYADRVTASAVVPVAVVVPPGKDGVGDRTLEMFESSPGWPCPVPDRRPGAVDDAVANGSRESNPERAGRESARANAGGECDRDMYPGRQGTGMFHDQRHEVDGLSVDDLRAEYARELAGVLEDREPSMVAAETGLDEGVVTTIAGEAIPAAFSLEDAAAILSLRDDVADAESVVEIACDHLLLGMTTGVMDVDAVAADLAIDLDAKEVQQKIERRAPMTFNEYVHIQHVIASHQH